MSTPKTEWNGRFVQYARVHGRTPEAQIEFDRERYPGGSMCGYVLWNKARIHEWKTLVNFPRCPGHPSEWWPGFEAGPATKDTINAAAYDKWLSELPVGHGVEKG